MTFRNTFRTAAIAALLLQAPIATAQYYNGGCSSCGTAAPNYAPMAASSCAPVASCTPVYSACYQTVPVTTYKQEKQTVSVPYYKTAYEDREVTYYEPVSRKRTVEVPTVSYQTVTENRTVHRDLGRWQTSYQPVSKASPCQVDPRPGLLGWLNRTGYSFRSAFTPNYRTSRQYVPNLVACNVPTSRQVAVRGTKRVVINETQMVARRKTERVEVKKLAWREETRTVSRPVTAWRTVPIGSSLAYGYGGYGIPGSTIAIVDEEDAAGIRKAERPEPDPNFSEPRGAFREDDDLRSSGRTFERDKAGDDDDRKFQRSSFSREEPLSAPLDSNSLQKPPRMIPHEDDGNTAPPEFKDFSTRRSQRDRLVPTGYSRKPAVTAGGWKARRTAREEESAVSSRGLAVPDLRVSTR